MATHEESSKLLYELIDKGVITSCFTCDKSVAVGGNTELVGSIKYFTKMQSVKCMHIGAVVPIHATLTGCPDYAVDDIPF